MTANPAKPPIAIPTIAPVDSPEEDDEEEFDVFVPVLAPDPVPEESPLGECVAPPPPARMGLTFVELTTAESVREADNPFATEGVAAA